MTVEEKRKYIDDCCERIFDKHGCEGCIFNNNSAWCHIGNGEDLNEKECDEVIETFKLRHLDILEQIEPDEEDLVNHPNHYTNGGMECIEEMVLIFGKEATMNFCLLNAWKYRYRAMDKNGRQDMDKSHWYIKKYQELKGVS